MMSQMTREFEEMYGVKGSITAQVLLNPANKPDAWELASLKQFDKGVTEVEELSNIDGMPYLRMMKPMRMKQSCVLCHGHLGFKVGDIRGGMSISIPLTPYLQAAESSRNFLIATHTVIWFLGIIGIVFLFYRSRQQDIEQQQAASAIKEREQQISDLLNYTAEGIFGIDKEGNCILANPACVDLLGYSSEDEIIGKDMHVLMHSRYADRSEYPVDQCLIYKSFRSNTEVHCDSEVFWRADGSSFAVEYWSYPVVRDDEVTGSVVTFFDISERLKAEQMLRRSQKMDALGQLTSGIAHDFNNQLGIVHGYMEMLDKHCADNEKASRWVATSQKATERCINLTRKLLNFSRQQQTNIELIDLKEEINELKELFQHTVTSAVTVSYEIAADLWPIETSLGDLEDALLNLVINARDAMPDGGKLSFNLYNQAPYQGEAGKDKIKSGDYVVIVITDTGCGIPKEIQEDIFDPFFSTKEVGKGTGLGMSMVYGFVNRNQGFINLYSEPGEGTRIKIHFPRAKSGDFRQKEIQSSEINEAKGHNKTILIVEDEVDLRELDIELLTIQGYHLLHADNGESAIKILSSDVHIDLLFCDIVMPGGINGYQVSEKARELRPHLDILLTSGLANVSPNSAVQAVMETNILQKPYSRSDLIECVGKFFEK
jgi:PAS domain S-box-containing protein